MVNWELEFGSTYNAFIDCTLRLDEVKKKDSLRVGIMCLGAPAGGINTAVRIAGRLCLNRGHTPLGIRNGFSGLANDEISRTH